MPLGTLVKETERRAELLRGTLHMLRHPDAIAQIKSLIDYRLKKATSRPPRKRTPPPDPAPEQSSAGEVRDEDR
jgi:hypothetical protein